MDSIPMKKIKVFLYIDSLMIGGMHRQVLYLAKHLNREIFEPIVCTQNTPRGGLRESYERVGCKLIDLERDEKKIDLSLVSRLLKVLKAEEPDVIFITAAPNLFYYRIAKLFYKKKILLVGSFRALTFWKGHLKKRYMPIDNILSRWLYSSSDHVVVNSIALKENYSKIINVEKSKPIEVIYNGSDFNFPVTREISEIRKELGVGINDVIVFMIARIDPWKDFFTFIKAVKIVVNRNKNVKFYIVGDGPLRSVIGQTIIEEGIIDNLKILGEKRDIFNYINAADISVLSTNGEGFSNSILESMSFSKPVIATAVGGNIELLGTENQFGLLVPPKSPQKFASAIISLVENKTQRETIGDAARKHILQLCDLKKCVSSYERIFASNFLNGE